MRKEIIKSICKSLDFPKGKLTDEYLFTIEAMDLFFYNGNIGAKDVQDGFVDGASDGGIDFVYSSEDTLYLVQGKSQDHITLEDIHNIFNKMEKTVVKFEKRDHNGFNKKLKSIYLNTIDNLPDNPNISLVLVTNAIISPTLEKEFREDADSNHLKDYTIILYDKNSIKINEYRDNMEQEYVEEDQMFIDVSKNYLKYGETGIIVNLMASSLKRIYEKHAGKGLFNYNLREHISQKSVDSGIENTILKEKDRFWYYNNGVTFAVEEFVVDGNKVKLYNFSIINGAQTTTKIGKSQLVAEKRDFPLVCKIVKSPTKLSENSTFMTKISEASNSQKPIKLRDLRANRMEQKILQVEASKNKNPLAVKIKRGVKPKNYNKVEKWQRVENEFLGQLILSFVLQKPGTARSGKQSIFSNDKVYNSIFRRTHDFDTLYDLVKLSNYYDEFKVDYTKNTDNVDDIAVARNGKFVILSIVGYMIKREKKTVISSYDEDLLKDNLSGTLISNYIEDDFQKILNEMFRFIIKNLKDIYHSKEKELKLTSYSNFFKTDKTYRLHILSQIDDRIYDDEFDIDRINKYMQIFDI